VGKETMQGIGGMSTRASTSATILRDRWLIVARTAWAAIATLAMGVFVASIPGYVSSILEVYRADLRTGPVEAPVALVITLDLLGVIASVTAASMCLTLAVVLFWRRSNDWMVVFVSSYLLLYGTIMAGPLEWAESYYSAWPALAVEVIQPLFLTTPTVALVVLFPNGTFVPRWTRWLIVASVALVAAILYLPEVSWGVLMVVILLGAFYAQVYRYRYVSSSTERQQTKWVTFGFLLWWLMVLMLGIPYTIGSNLPPGSALPWWTDLDWAWWIVLMIVPLSLSIAVLRYRLYDIDVVINRALVYGSLTVTLVLVYFGGVATTQALFRTITGQERLPQLAVVVSTLAIAALFDPLRRRIQAFIDRRFYRRKYDARKTLEEFSARLREETNLDSLNAELISVVQETMQPEHVSLWMHRDILPEDRRPR
jgi:hypothetical protein